MAFGNKMQMGCCGCGSSTPTAACAPCNVPKSTLTLSWYYWQPTFGTPTGTTYGPAGPVSTALAFQGGAGPTFTWTSGWFLGPSDTVTCNDGGDGPGGAGAQCCWLRFTLTCSTLQGTKMRIEMSDDPTAPHQFVTNASGTHDGYGSSVCWDGTLDAQVGAATYTCSPFMVTYGNTGFVGNMFYSGVLTP